MNFDDLEYLNVCGECNNSVILGKCHICNNTKKYRKNRFLIQSALERLFEYKLPVYINQEILPDISSLEFDFLIKKIDKEGNPTHCLLIDTTMNKSDLTIRKIYNLFNLSIKNNFTFYYLLIDNCKPNVIANFIFHYYPKIEEINELQSTKKVPKYYTFCKNIVVNKSKVNINKLSEVLEIYNTKLSLVKLNNKKKKENETLLLLDKLNSYLIKTSKHGIRELKDLNKISSLPEYDSIYESIEILMTILKLNKYDVPHISNLIFEKNKFIIKSGTLNKDKFNAKLKLIKYKIVEPKKDKNKVIYLTNSI